MAMFASVGILVVKATVHFYWDTHYVNLITGERRLLDGQVPLANILAKAIRDTIVTILFMLLPGIVKLLGLIQQFGQNITKLWSRSG
jgi:hypothetical protein